VAASRARVPSPIARNRVQDAIYVSFGYISKAATDAADDKTPA
jgi:hypothetical protein